MTEQIEQKKMPKWKKAIIISLLSFLGLIIIAISTFYGVFFQ